jgi:hypothetical protein
VNSKPQVQHTYGENYYKNWHHAIRVRNLNSPLSGTKCMSRKLFAKFSYLNNNVIIKEDTSESDKNSKILYISCQEIT